MNTVNIVDDEGKVISHDPGVKCRITFHGDGNTVQLHKDVKFNNIRMILGDNVRVEIDRTIHVLDNIFISAMRSQGGGVVIGKNFSCVSVDFLLCEKALITIGDDCMVSSAVKMWASDCHSIIDLNSNKVYNRSKGITVGDHVWICDSSRILKNTFIGDNSIIGNSAVVSGCFTDKNVIIAGMPAKIIKRNINWNRYAPPALDINEEVNNNKMKKIIAVIPSRYASSRFPGKPLAMILGKPMIQWVYERVLKVDEISDAYVATDDEKIFNAVIGFGGKAVMTGNCSCGTDRVYQACKDIDCDIVLNIQGDEPMIKPEMIRDLIRAFDDPNVKMATLKKEIDMENDINNPNIAKLITDANSNAIYFSRSTVPFNRDGKQVKYYKHIGVYGYTKEFLKEFVSLPKSMLEEAEQLEQLRAIENGYKIKVVETQYQSIGVDLPEHIEIVEEEIKKELGK